MVGVNKQLALFFEQVGIRSSLKKSIAVFIAAYILFVINFDVVRILVYYIKIDKIYYYTTVWLYFIVYYSLYLVVTLVFYFLADFGLEARIIQERPEINQ